MPDPIDWLIVGLGNPGPEYEDTAHNLGFLVVDRLGERNKIRVTRKDSMALVGNGSISGSKVLLAKPQTFMNVSGVSVKGLLTKNEVNPERLLLIYDELDLPWKSLRIRRRSTVTDLVPGRILGTLADRLERLSEHPVGWAV